jgi:hypothetical protein
VPFPPDALSTLTLPEGATSGRRIELDGPGTAILAYDADDNVIGRFAPSLAGDMELQSLDPGGAEASLFAASNAAFVELLPESWATHTRTAGRVTADIDEGNERARLILVSPTVDGNDQARMFLNSEDADGVTQPIVEIDGGALLADLRLNTRSLGRGVPSSGRFTSTGNDSARAAGAATDMAVTVSLVGGRAYLVSPMSALILGTASAAYGIELTHDGTVVGRFRRIGTGESADTLAHLSEPVIYVPSADDSSATLAVANGSGSGGSITCVPGTPGVRTLTVVDIGRP